MYPIADWGILLLSRGGLDVVTTNLDFNDESVWDDSLDLVEEISEDFEDNGEIWCGGT